MTEDINARLQASGFGMGGPKGGAEEYKANEDDVSAFLVSGANKWLYIGVKLTGAIPIIGPLLSSILPANPGTVSAFAGMESEGLAGKPIRVGSGGPQGGVLAKIFSELGKNSAITDHTAGVGGDASGGGGSGDGGGGGSSGGDSTGGHHYESAFAGLEAPIIVAGGGNRFEHMDVSENLLGSFRPSYTPNMGQGVGAGMDLG